MSQTMGTRARKKAGKGASRTPLMEQYGRIKREHPDAFLFFRLGDFYEMFHDDAVQASALLGLTLTSRNRQDPDPIPMCGIPWHQRDPYVARLLRLGHKVAICDQLEDASESRGLVERGVTEILTPGSVTGDAFLEPAASNYLAALCPAEQGLGVCIADASTGEARLAQHAWDDAAGFVARLRVSEWMTPRVEEMPETLRDRLESVLRGLTGARTPIPAGRFAESDLARSRWPTAAGGDFDDLPLALRAGAAMLAYMDRVQGGLALQFQDAARLSEDGILRYDAATARHLELFEPSAGGERQHTLWHHLNLTVTAPGARRLRAWIERPIAEAALLATRQEAIARWVDAGLERGRFRDAVRGLPDLERLAARVACGKATPRDLASLRAALERLPEIREALGRVAGKAGRTGSPSDGWELARQALAGAPELAARLQRALVDDPPTVASDGGIIRSGYDLHRDQLHDLAHSGKRWIAELEASERARTGITSLKVGYNRVFGYYLEVTRPHLDKVPDDYERRQTLTQAERFITPGLKLKEQEVLTAEEKLKAAEHALFTALREEAAGHLAALRRAAEAVATLDAEASLAEAAARYGWTRPVITDSDRLVAEGVRHPVVERLLAGGAFVPNSVSLDGASRQILLLTGPNMGGKSTYLRQTALLVLLAQTGSFVPAECAEIGLVDRLFTRVGASDRLGAGQSTFMVEMQETADILASATSRSLVLLDEIGRGTATYDGLALAWAVTEHLHHAAGPRPRTIFATHYHELTQLAGLLPRLANVHVVVEERGDEVVFLHRVADGTADRSYGIHVAQLAGLPGAVIARAKDVLRELESERTAEHLAGIRRGPVEAAATNVRRGEAFAHEATPDGSAGAAQAPDAASAGQLGLFGNGPHPLEALLRTLDPERMTPLEALERLSEWKRRWGA